MDEAAVLAAVDGLTDADGRPLLRPDDVAGIIAEEGWVSVQVRKEGANATEFLARVHEHLAGAFPGVEVDFGRMGGSIATGPGSGRDGTSSSCWAARAGSASRRSRSTWP
jgi:hypothetical protein